MKVKLSPLQKAFYDICVLALNIGMRKSEIMNLQWIDIKEDVIEGDEISVPYLVVLTQECDLEQDYENRLETENANTTNDKYLQSILVSPAYLAEKLRKGTHLEALELNMQLIDSKRWKNVINNQNSRYHYLPANEKFKIPELVIDFKHYYTLPHDFFYQYLLCGERLI